jgi:hypothetical protein
MRTGKRKIRAIYFKRALRVQLTCPRRDLARFRRVCQVGRITRCPWTSWKVSAAKYISFWISTRPLAAVRHFSRQFQVGTFIFWSEHALISFSGLTHGWPQFPTIRPVDQFLLFRVYHRARVGHPVSGNSQGIDA